jgi:hypothetical protein
VSNRQDDQEDGAVLRSSHFGTSAYLSLSHGQRSAERGLGQARAAPTTRRSPTANRPPSSPISCRSRPAMESTWRSWRVPSGARPRLAARSFTRTRGSLVKYGLRSGPSGFARRSRRRATGSVGSSGRRSRARLAKIPFCASLAMRRKDAEGDRWGHTSEVRRARKKSQWGPEAGIAPARLGCDA